MSARRRTVLASLVCLATVVTFPARGDDKTVAKKACAAAYQKAQTDRDAHKLRDAREAMRACSQSSCPAFIVKDCTGWLVDIETRVPSVVLSAKDARGQALTDVTVSMDGATFAPKLDGQSVEVDPGPHAFSFVASDGTKVDQAFTVLEGQKAQTVAVTIPTAASIAAQKVEQDAPRPPPPIEASTWTTQRKIAVATGVVGVASLGVGGVFGALTFSATSKQKSDCASPTNCTNHGQALSDHSSAQTDGTVSDIALVAGGALLAAGAVLFFAAGQSAERPAASTGLAMIPAIGPGAAGLSFRAEF